jgi:antitoxin HicB
MHSLAYVAAVTRDGDDYVASVRDLPQVVTAGDTEAEAWEIAADAIEVVVATLLEREMDIPTPSPVRDGERLIALPSHLAAKVAVYQAWRHSGIRKTELARRMGRSETEVRRILDPHHGTKIDQLDEAARALGGRVVIQFEAS